MDWRSICGLRSWNNGDVLKADMLLEGHHIYPRAYVMQAYPNIKLEALSCSQSDLRQTSTPARK